MGFYGTYSGNDKAQNNLMSRNTELAGRTVSKDGYNVTYNAQGYATSAARITGNGRGAGGYAAASADSVLNSAQPGRNTVGASDADKQYLSNADLQNIADMRALAQSGAISWSQANNYANTNAGFDHAETQSALGDLSTAVTTGFGNVQNSLCSGFAGVNATVNGAQNAISQQLNSNELASLNRSFAEQAANTQGFNGVQSSLCDIRYGNATNTRDIIDAQTRGTQAVLDKLCQLELDTVKTQLAQAQRENVGLQNQLNMANLATSQTAQTAQILAGQTAEVDALYNRLNSCPVPTTPVYGRTPIFSCNNGCGCANGLVA